MVLDKIAEMQLKQGQHNEKVCIVETIEDFRMTTGTLVSPMGILSSQRVTTVEEQQTQEDMEDEESAKRSSI
jgi:hypothetical protein